MALIRDERRVQAEIAYRRGSKLVTMFHLARPRLMAGPRRGQLAGEVERLSTSREACAARPGLRGCGPRDSARTVGRRFVLDQLMLEPGRRVSSRSSHRGAIGEEDEIELTRLRRRCWKWAERLSLAAGNIRVTPGGIVVTEVGYGCPPASSGAWLTFGLRTGDVRHNCTVRSGDWIRLSAQQPGVELSAGPAPVLCPPVEI